MMTKPRDDENGKEGVQSEFDRTRVRLSGFIHELEATRQRAPGDRGGLQTLSLQTLACRRNKAICVPTSARFGIERPTFDPKWVPQPLSTSKGTLPFKVASTKGA